MSMNAASPNTSDVCVGDSPMWSAHKGRRDWRAVREAPSTTTDVPMVNSTNRCRFITLHTDGCRTVPARVSAVRSGMGRASKPESKEVVAASTNTAGSR